MASVNPYAVISAIFHFLPEKEFENNREKLHSAFYRIRKKHRALLNDLSFRKSLLFPRSHLLDDILASLQPEFLGKMNPDLERYSIKPDRLEKLWNEDLKSTLGDKEPEIKEIAGELCAILRG